MGKGSRRRPAQVPDHVVARRWDRTFGPPMCEGCGEEMTDDHDWNPGDDFHVFPDHDPRCHPDDPCRYCPVPVRCGPVR